MNSLIYWLFYLKNTQVTGRKMLYTIFIKRKLLVVINLNKIAKFVRHKGDQNKCGFIKTESSNLECEVISQKTIHTNFTKYILLYKLFFKKYCKIIYDIIILAAFALNECIYKYLNKKVCKYMLYSEPT